MRLDGVLSMATAVLRNLTSSVKSLRFVDAPDQTSFATSRSVSKSSMMLDALVVTSTM